MDNRTRYEGIDGLKAYAIIGIALMHVLANGEYSIGGFVFERLIPSFTNLVFLFMMVSGFGMCCGYYQKIIDQKISVEDFYKKRYIKIWPYFTLLCALDFMMSPSKESLFEVFANLTLCQGLLPNANIKEARFLMRKACVEKAEEFRLDISHQQMKNIYKNLLREQEKVK